MQSIRFKEFQSLLLVIALFFSTLAIAPLSVAAQTKPDEQNTAKNEDNDKKDKDTKDKKDDDDDDDKKPNSSANRPLKPNEDPSMIGQRKINKGTDKLFGWLGGSREKEME